MDPAGVMRPMTLSHAGARGSEPHQWLAVNHRLWSGPTVIEFGSRCFPKVVLTPTGVIRLIPYGRTYQRFPSGPAVMSPHGELSPSSKLVVSPVGATRSMPESVVN